MEHIQKLEHIKKISLAINALRIVSAVSIGLIFMLIVGVVSFNDITCYLVISLSALGAVLMVRIRALNCCPWCGSSYLWKNAIFNEIVIDPLSWSTKNGCANCGMPEKEK